MNNKNPEDEDIEDSDLQKKIDKLEEHIDLLGYDIEDMEDERDDL